jgi:hypothetical protein
MASSTGVHVGDTITLEVIYHDANDAAIDISGATTKSVFLQPPSGPAVTKAGAFTSTGVDGALKYDCLTGDLTMPGVWKYQTLVILPVGSKTYISDQYSFNVSGRLI